jgi:hypothetical protein
MDETRSEIAHLRRASHIEYARERQRLLRLGNSRPDAAAADEARAEAMKKTTEKLPPLF